MINRAFLANFLACTKSDDVDKKPKVLTKLPTFNFILLIYYYFIIIILNCHKHFFYDTL